MKKENKKLSYETAEAELVILEFSDIVTASDGNQGTSSETPPTPDNWGDWT